MTAQGSPDVEVGRVERGTWGGRFEFLVTCVGYSVGLGNIWRFPYLCYSNGGGAFLFPYIVMLVVIGMPILYLELLIGQFSSRGPITVWALSPIFKGLGIAMVVTSWMLSLYYIIILAWALYFLFASFNSVVPWDNCDNSWNTHLCFKTSHLSQLAANSTALNITLTERNITDPEALKTPSEEYFYNKVLQLSVGLGRSWPPVWELALCLLLAWLIVFLVLIKGIKSLGKVSYFFSLFPYVMLTVLLVRGATLEGAMEGISFYLNPRPEKLSDPLVWVDAAVMVFFSIGTCCGSLIAISSYNNFKHNVYRDSVIVPVVVGLTSVYCGFVIFTVLGFMSHVKNVPIHKVAAHGPGLVFVVYPEALSLLPLAPVWSVLFFIMVLTIGFGTQFSWLEALFVAIMDEFPDIFRVNTTRPIILRAVCIAVFYPITLPMVSPGGFYLFSLTDHFASGFPMLVTGLIELVVVCYVYGYTKFAEDIRLMLGNGPSLFMKICWLVLTPLILILCITMKCVLYEPFSLDDYVYPAWGQALGWLQVGFILMWLPLWTIISISMALKGLKLQGKDNPLLRVWNIIRSQAQPLASWRPADAINRTGTRYETSQLKSTEEPSGSNPIHSSMTSTGITISTISGNQAISPSGRVEVK